MGSTSAHTFPTHADLTYLTGHSVRGLMMCAQLIPAVQPEQTFAAGSTKVCCAEQTWRSGHDVQMALLAAKADLRGRHSEWPLSIT
jgi:hypothetical protein